MAQNKARRSRKADIRLTSGCCACCATEMYRKADKTYDGQFQNYNPCVKYSRLREVNSNFVASRMTEESDMWSTHDLACAHCRTRKIRCGRERPQCESCKRDGVECRYSSPGKRVNHVKLLCQNFEVLEDQLNTIQGDLSALTSLMKNNPATKAAHMQEEELDLEGSPEPNGSRGFSKNHYIVRDESRSSDQYHAPGSLYALCREFGDDRIFKEPQADFIPENEGLVPVLLKKLCTDASNEDCMEHCPQRPAMTLPPRQLLSTMAGKFFKNADFATDLFVQSSFLLHMDRIYAAQTLCPADEAWAVCFNMIVLLAMGYDRYSSNIAPVQPFISSLQNYINNIGMFLTPRLVNLQALALLSIAAEYYSSLGTADLIFAQACLLAKKMGLHQSRALCEGYTPEEVIERHKVFRSLYIRDKNSAICRGSEPWLENCGSRAFPVSDQLDDKEASYVPRLQLAHIQDDVHRSFYSGQVTPSKRSQLVSKFERELENWMATYQMTNNAFESVDSAILLLSFLSTRIAIFRGSSEERHKQQALKDSKASCIILLRALGHRLDSHTSEILDQLFDQPCSLNFSRSVDDNCVVERLPASFPLAAIFLVTKNILEPITSEDDSLFRTEEEISLLEELRDCFADHQLENFASMLNRTLDTLVRVIRLKTSPHTASTPSMIFNDLTSLQSQSSSCRNSPPARPNSPIDGLLAMAGHVDASNTSFLLPFMQPTSAPDMSMQWATSYGQQIDPFGRVCKRPRLSNEPDLFDVATAFGESDPFALFDFLGEDNEFPVFGGVQ